MDQQTTPASASPLDALVTVTELILTTPDGCARAPFSWHVNAGLHVVQSDDERVTQQLFEFMSGTRAVEDVSIVHRAASVYWQPNMRQREHETQLAKIWLQNRGATFTRWSPDLAAELVAEFGLEKHIQKPLYMLSLGSFRKLNLVAAFACAADVTCLEHPFAALDGPSCSLLSELLDEAAAHTTRAWIVADFAVPAALANTSQLTVVNLDTP